ncbi:MAG: right-handed parallel beta-helix repeat-containing protein, partial [Pyrinomonadaceae bacterium]
MQRARKLRGLVRSLVTVVVLYVMLVVVARGDLPVSARQLAQAVDQRLSLLALFQNHVLSTRFATPKFASIPSPAAPLLTFTVTNTNDSGIGSLREAMQDANNNAGPDTINFNIPGAGVQTITLLSGLPGLNQPTVIDGRTQPGFAGTPLIELNGNGVSGDGLVFLGGDSTVRGLIINRFSGNGITAQNTGNNVFAGNYIGTNAAGTAALPNGQNGIQLLGPPSNTIGGLTAADRNVISGNNQTGIVIQNSSATGNTVIGNYIGTNAAGTAAVGNGANGVRIDAPGEIIGGGSAGARNVISGNAQAGVLLINSGPTNNRLQGNYIGTDAAGASAVPNQSGVLVGDQVLLRGVSNSIVGTDGDGVSDATEGNVISGNLQDGVTLLQGGTTNNRVAGNRIGTDAAGTAPIPNGRDGVRVQQAAAGNVIGTNGDGLSDALERNIIS